MSKNEIKYTYQLRVRYADTDKMGIVYNGNYLTYFEIGRTELMRNFGLPYSDLENKGYLLPLSEAYVQYKLPAQYDQLIDIETKLVWHGEPTIRFEYNILHNETNLCKGHTVHVFLNSETRSTVKPPKLFVELIDKIRN